MMEPINALMILSGFAFILPLFALIYFDMYRLAQEGNIEDPCSEIPEFSH